MKTKKKCACYILSIILIITNNLHVTESNPGANDNGNITTAS